MTDSPRRDTPTIPTTTTFEDRSTFDDAPSIERSSDVGAAPTIRLGGPDELVALLPYLLGFHPKDSMAVVGMDGRKVVFALRLDLPPDGEALPSGLAGWVTGTLTAQALSGVVLVAYCGPARVNSASDELRDALVAAGLPLLDRLRVAGDRFWSDDCGDPDCCPPGGRDYATVRDRIAAVAASAGLTALADRAQLIDRIAPVSGVTRTAMDRATARAELREASIMDRSGSEVTGAAALLAAGAVAVRQAMTRYQSGRAELSDDEAAWLGVVLRGLPVRDLAWEWSDRGDPDRHRALWTELARRVAPDDVAAPAALLGYVCWQQGDGAMAGLALGHALAADHTYTMAVLLSQALAAGIPPSAWRVASPLTDDPEG